VGLRVFMVELDGIRCFIIFRGFIDYKTVEHKEISEENSFKTSFLERFS
jgi:hypothetical protein